jgi:hypothetical protein
VTAPNTPNGPGRPATPPQIEPRAPGELENAVGAVPQEADEPDEPREPWTALALSEVRTGLVVVLASALLGVVIGLLWCWIAPRVPLYADATSVYLKDPEGEQQAAADGWFAVLGAIAGAVVAAAAFWRTRRREGGLGVAAGLALGGLLGSWIAWQVGSALGPGKNLVADAKKVPLGHVFYAPIDLHARAALVVWPAFALIVLIAAMSTFTHHHHDR